MNENIKKVIYIKSSSHGIGSIPIGTEGKVLLYVKHPITAKLLVDFNGYGRAIVPLSSVREVES